MEGGRALQGMPWCDEYECLVCGAQYREFNSGTSFDEGAERVREANGGYAAGGGYRSLGPVLWALRCIKLDRWAEAHYECGFTWHELQQLKRDCPF